MPTAHAQEHEPVPQHGSRPDADPTILTTQQSRHDLSMLRDILETKLDGDVATLETRLNGMDKAIELLQKSSDKMPEFVRDQVGQLRALHDEKIAGSTTVVNEKIKSLSDVTTQQFKSIDDRFAEKDKAVSVGLQAQKESAAAQQASNTEATTKMESNLTKLLDQGRELLTEVRKNTDVQINDIKSRLDKGEGRVSVSDPIVSNAVQELMREVRGLKVGEGETKGAARGSSDVVAYVIAAAGLLFGAVSVVAAVVTVIVMLTRPH